jgi:predicted RNA-binding Zn-ribbon protein involved in translation (DUF1610 family)
MERRRYTTLGGVQQWRPIVSQRDAWDGTLGFCLACGTEAEGVEPDARKYRCPQCGQLKVYGLEELAVMNLLTIRGAKEED